MAAARSRRKTVDFRPDPVTVSGPEMDGTSNDARKKRYFLWGTALTWILSIPVVLGIFSAFRGIQQEKATGLAAVAGAISEMYATLGLVLGFVIPVGAIVLLVKSFSGGHRMRTLFSVLYICWSAFSLVLAGLFVWVVFIYMPHAANGTR